MKTVVRHEDCDVVELRNISDGRYYGVETDYDRGFIMRHSYGGSSFHVPVSDGLTRSNSLASVESTTLREIANKCLMKDYKVFEFGTSRELFLWLAGEEG